MLQIEALLEKQWEVTAVEAGMKLLEFLKKHHEAGESSRQLKRFVDQGLCRINQRVERHGSALLHKGDVVCLQQRMRGSSSVAFDKSRLIYEDDFLFAYNKPAGVSSDEEGIGKVLREHIPTFYFLHRLDKETSGVLLFAKDRETETALLEGFKKRAMQKEYLAVVDGVPSTMQGHIENTLVVKAKVGNQTLWEVSSTGEGKSAITDWKLVKQGSGVSVIRCFPKTGRMHQLRVHLKSLGHPILGDSLYAKEVRCTCYPTRMLLHAEKLAFVHPRTQQSVICLAPIPEDLKGFLSLLCRDEEKKLTTEDTGSIAVI